MKFALKCINYIVFCCFYTNLAADNYYVQQLLVADHKFPEVLQVEILEPELGGDIVLDYILGLEEDMHWDIALGDILFEGIDVVLVIQVFVGQVVA